MWKDQLYEWVGWLAGTAFAVFQDNLVIIGAVAGATAFIIGSYFVYCATRYLYRKARSGVALLYLLLFLALNKFGDGVETIEIRTRRTVGRIMAKWKKGFVADLVFDALFKAACEGKLSNSDMKRMSNLVGKALDIDDLVTRKRHKNAIKNALRKHKLAGPKPEAFKGAGGPPALHIPPVEAGNVVSRSQFLQRMKDKAA